MHLFGIDWNGPLPDEEDMSSVDIPNVRNPLSEHDYAELLRSISPLNESTSFGTDLYLNVLNFVCQKLLIG